MNTTVRLMAALVSAGTMMAAGAAEDAPYYAGVSAAWSQVDIPVDKVTASLGSKWSGAPTEVDDKGDGLKIYVGREWRRWLAFEAGYSDLGRVSTYSTVRTSTSLDTAAVQWDGYAIDASVLGIWRIGSVLSLYGRGGAAWWEVTRKEVTNGTSGYSSHSSGDSGLSPLLGAGAAIRFTARGTLRVEYQRYFDIKDPDTQGNTDIDVLSIGAHYHF